MSKAKAIREAKHPKARARGGKTPAERFGRAVHLVREGNEALMELTKTGVQKPKRLGNVAMLQQMSAAQEVMNEGLNPAAGMSGAFGTGALMGALGAYYVSQHAREQAEKQRKEKEESEDKIKNLLDSTKSQLADLKKENLDIINKKEFELLKADQKFKAETLKHESDLKIFVLNQRAREVIAKHRGEANNVIDKFRRANATYIGKLKWYKTLMKRLIDKPRKMKDDMYEKYFDNPEHLNTPLVEKVIKPLRLVRKIKTLLVLYKDPAKDDENADDTAYARALKVSEEIVKPLLKKYSAYDTKGEEYRNLKRDTTDLQPMEVEK